MPYGGALLLLLLLLFFVICQFLFSIPIVNATVDDDAALVYFVKGHVEFDKFCTKKGVTNKQSKEILAKTYGVHLGILYFLRQNWHCAEINKKEIFGLQRVDEDHQQQRKGCEHYRKYLDNLYEYLYNVHTEGLNAVMPQFEEFRDTITLIGVIKDLFWIWTVMKWNNERQIKFDGVNHPPNQRRKFLDKFWRKISSSDNESRRTEFDQIMEKMLKKAEQLAIEAKNTGKLAFESASAPMPTEAKASATIANVSAKTANESMTTKASMPKAEPSSSSSPSLSRNGGTFPMGILLDLAPIYCMNNARSDEEFLASIEGIIFRKGSSNYFEKMSVVMLYLMRKHWHCDTANRNEFFGMFEAHRNRAKRPPDGFFEFFDRSQCDKFGQYVTILYEYLFRVNYKIATDRPRPIFQMDDQITTIMDTVVALEQIGAFYFGDAEMQYAQFMLLKTDLWHHSSSLKLLNRDELDYLQKEIMPFQEALVKLSLEPSNAQKTSAPVFSALLRQQFDQKLEAFVGGKKRFKWLNW